MDKSKEYFSRIYEEYVERIFRFVYLKTGSQELAEDLTAEVFKKGWKAYQSTEIDNMQAFLYKIARNIVADHYRRGSSFTFFSLDQSTLEFVDYSDKPDDQAGTNMEMDIIRKALLGLPEDYQNLVIWRYIDELDISEIANLTGKTEQNVRVGIHRGIKMLRDQLPDGAQKALGLEPKAV